MCGSLFAVHCAIQCNNLGFKIWEHDLHRVNVHVIIVLIDFSAAENSTLDPTCCILLPRILCQTYTFSKPQSVDRE